MQVQAFAGSRMIRILANQLQRRIMSFRCSRTLQLRSQMMMELAEGGDFLPDSIYDCLVAEELDHLQALCHSDDQADRGSGSASATGAGSASGSGSGSGSGS
jgi:hypothetical protein